MATIGIFNLIGKAENRNWDRKSSPVYDAMITVNSGKQIQHKGYYKECPQ